MALIGLVIVTHGQLAEEFRLAMEHVVGAQDGLATVCIGAEDDIEMRRTDIAAAIETCDLGEGVIVLTDMFGGTPSNLAISLMGRPKLEVIAGVNLPMLIKLAAVREEGDLSKAVSAAQDAGRKYINVASQLLTPN